MGKFDGILICADLDDTLLTDDKKVSEENKKSIEYFKREGGLFTFATGRVPMGMKPILAQIEPNAPVLCYNGAGIYDIKRQKLLWSLYLGDEMKDLCDFVNKGFASAGIEICTDEKVYFIKENNITRHHQEMENFPDNNASLEDVTEPVKKILFMVESEEIEELKDFIQKSPYADKFTFMQSSPWYYEALPLNADKGTALCELGKILNIPREHIVAMGDNENDIPLVKKAGVGIAVLNAVDGVKDAADYITVDNNSDAVAAVIRGINDEKIVLDKN